MEPVKVKREYGKDLCFWGSMDEQYTLPFGSPDDVRRRCSTVSPPSGRTAASFCADSSRAARYPARELLGDGRGGHRTWGNCMNSIERVGAAIELQEPDRVPVDLHDFQVAARASGLPMSEIFRDGALLAEAMLAAWREFGHDMILLENGTACSAEACGMVVRYGDDTAPVAGRPILDSLSEVADLQVPDPYVTFPMSEILKATAFSRARSATKLGSARRADQGPMDLAAELRGISEFMMDLATGEEEGLVHALLDYARRVATRYAYA